MLAAYTPGFAAERQVISEDASFSDEVWDGLTAGNGAALFLQTPGTTITVENSVFTGNTANHSTQGYGGAIYENANLSAQAEFTNNTANFGGAIFNSVNGNLSLTDSSFSGNTATKSGGAIYTSGEAVIENTSFQSNTATSVGGAVFNQKNLALTNSSFTENTAAQGGALFNYTGATATISNSIFSNNAASTYAGGAINNSNGTLIVQNNTVFENNSALLYGGALAADGTVTIEDSSFTNNSVSGDGTNAGQGGAILQFLNKTNPGILNVKNTTFQSNKATSESSTGGAVDIYGQANFDNVTFTGNTVEASSAVSGGGAAHVGAESQVAFNNSTFTENTASYGGAIRTRDATIAGNSAAKLDITNSTFSKNTANYDGGAFYNNFYNSTAKGDAAYTSGNTFTQNSAQNGGAIYNSGTADAYSNVASLYVADSTFTNNTASGNGGAIYNGGTLTLAGNNTFTGNTAAEGADIYNAGTLTINDTTTLDGGIAGDGTINVNGTLNIGQAEVKADTLAFANGSTLGVEFGNNKMGNLKANTITVGENASDTAKLQVVLSKDFLTTDKTEHSLTNGTAVTNGKFAMADVTNALYNVSFDDASNIVTAQRKSQEEQQEAVENVGGTANDVAVTAAFTSASDLGNDTTNKVADVINTLAQTDTAALVKVTKAVAPEVAPAKQVVHTAVLNEVFGALQHRMADAAVGTPAMYALGDAKGYKTAQSKNFSVWTQGLLNKSHKEGTSSADAFTGRSTGVAAGADMRVGESGLVGLGYAYTHTNVSSTGRHDRILGDTFFLYGQYRPSAFYVQGSMAYGNSKYEESKYLPGLTLDADYHVQHYAMQGRVGYDVTEWFSPNMGLRYTRLHQEGYNDGAQSVSADNANYFTGMLGADFQMQQRLSQHVSLLPHLYTGLAYDFASDDNNSRVTLPNATGYDVKGERLHRLAFEIGAGATVRLYSSVEIIAGYEGSFRQDFNSHTGTLKLRYLF